MRTNRVTPKGIIRLTGEHDAGDGACDEVINLRYEQGSMRLCGPKGLLATSTTIFLAFYRHRLPGTDRYIGIYVANNKKKVATVTIGQGLATPDSPAIAEFDAGDTLDVKFINNLLIISSADEHKIYTFAYIDGAYSLFSDGTLPSIQLTGTKTDYYGAVMTTKEGTLQYRDVAGVSDYTLEGVAQRFSDNDNLSIQNVIDEINAGVSFIRSKKDKHKTEGWVAVCANFTLFDNSQTKPSQPIWFYLGGEPSIRFGLDGTGLGTAAQAGQGHMHISMPTSSLSVHINAIVGHDFAKYKDLIKSINIYSTHPHSGFDIEKSFNSGLILPSVRDWADKWKKNHNTSYVVRIFRNTIVYDYNTLLSNQFAYAMTDPSELDGELFRLQKTIPYQSSLSNMTQEVVQLDFSETALAGQLMPTENSGYIGRFGQMTTYNSRLHLYDITNKFSLPGDGGDPDALFGQSWMHRPDLLDLDSSVSGSFVKNLAAWTGETISVATAICEIRTRKEGVTLTAYRNIKVPYFTITGSNFKVAVIRARPTVTDVDSYNVRMFTSQGYAEFALHPSMSYNHADAYATSGSGMIPLETRLDGDFAFPPDAIPEESGAAPSNYMSDAYEYACVALSSTDVDYTQFGDDVVEYSEDDTVVVSAQNNPTYFSPENSYRIGGKVLAVSPNAGAVSDVQVGQYPLAVFTDNGIYTLIQGDGKVLYSNVAKIAEDVMKEGSYVMPTTYGITFLSGDGVFLLVGRNCQRISLALDGPPDWDIRQCQQYINAHECTYHHLSAWKNGADYVYTYTDEPTVGDIVYDKYGDSLSLTISAVSGQTITVASTTYTYTESANRNLLYNIAPYLSDDFRDEIADASKVRLLFDAYKAELIVSITDKPYSYVYSFVERQWHKITETFAFGSEALALVYPPVATGAAPMCEIRNINEETFGINEPVMVHLQTRCVKFGTESYKAVHRLLGRVNVNNTHDYDIPNGDITGMYLYASRDLRHWSMVGLYQHKGYTDLMHINKTAAHFKYFLITFGGKLIKDSEITGFDADVLYRYQDKER